LFLLSFPCSADCSEYFLAFSSSFGFCVSFFFHGRDFDRLFLPNPKSDACEMFFLRFVFLPLQLEGQVDPFLLWYMSLSEAFLSFFPFFKYASGDLRPFFLFLGGSFAPFFGELVPAFFFSFPQLRAPVRLAYDTHGADGLFFRPICEAPQFVFCASDYRGPEFSVLLVRIDRGGCPRNPDFSLDITRRI